MFDLFIEAGARLFKRRELWSIALYRLKEKNHLFKLNSLKPFLYIGENGIRLDKNYKATVADPFLFSQSGKLYIFYEVQTDFGIGQIHAHSLDTDGICTDHGLVLKENFHLSYPQVFEHGGKIFMIPESAASGKVWLYSSHQFPYEWKKVTTLIKEPLVDTSIILTDEFTYLLGTTRDNELKLYYSNDLEQEFTDTGMSLSKDKLISRNAGRPINIDGILYRFSQNCRNSYGENISISRIESISPYNYSEQLVVSDLFTTKPKWMELGHHHISLSSFGSEYIVAVDGKRKDKYINTLMLAVLKILGGRNG
jgi:hypothetical protein